MAFPLTPTLNQVHTEAGTRYKCTRSSPRPVWKLDPASTDIPGLHAVASSGAYADLTGRPAIGSGPNSLVQTDGAGKLPALDASQLVNLPGTGGGGGDPAASLAEVQAHSIANKYVSPATMFGAISHGAFVGAIVAGIDASPSAEAQLAAALGATGAAPASLGEVQAHTITDKFVNPSTMFGALSHGEFVRQIVAGIDADATAESMLITALGIGGGGSGPPSASLAEVQAHTIANKYVAPSTLYDGIGHGEYVLRIVAGIDASPEAEAQLAAALGVGAPPGDGTITNAKLATAPAFSRKYRNAGSSGAPSDYVTPQLTEVTSPALTRLIETSDPTTGELGRSTLSHLKTALGVESNPGALVSNWGALVAVSSPMAHNAVIDTGFALGRRQRLHLRLTDFFQSPWGAVLQISFNSGASWHNFLETAAALNSAVCDFTLVTQTTNVTIGRSGAFINVNTFEFDQVPSTNNATVRFRILAGTSAGSVTWGEFRYAWAPL